MVVPSVQASSSVQCLLLLQLAIKFYVLGWIVIFNFVQSRGMAVCCNREECTLLKCHEMCGLCKRLLPPHCNSIPKRGMISFSKGSLPNRIFCRVAISRCGWFLPTCTTISRFTSHQSAFFTGMGPSGYLPVGVGVAVGRPMGATKGPRITLCLTITICSPSSCHRRRFRRAG